MHRNQFSLSTSKQYIFIMPDISSLHNMEAVG